MPIIFPDMSAVLDLHLVPLYMCHDTEYIYTDDIFLLLWNSSHCYLIHSMLLQQQWSKQRRFLSLIPLLYKVDDLDKGIESIFIKFADNTKLGMNIDLLQGRKTAEGSGQPGLIAWVQLEEIQHGQVPGAALGSQ